MLCRLGDRRGRRGLLAGVSWGWWGAWERE